jgi:hypothetical protein
LYIFQKKLPEVNNRPTSENSPNLVTLARKNAITFALKAEAAITPRSGAGLPDFT